MIYLLEIDRAFPKLAPPVVKECVRFGRRLRAHRILNYRFPSFVTDDYGATVLVGDRVVEIAPIKDDRGEIVDAEIKQQVRPAWVGDSWRFDRQATSAMRQRNHAKQLERAAKDRGEKWPEAARAALSGARHDRQRAEAAASSVAGLPPSSSSHYG